MLEFEASGLAAFKLDRANHAVRAGNRFPFGTTLWPLRGGPEEQVRNAATEGIDLPLRC